VSDLRPSLTLKERGGLRWLTDRSLDASTAVRIAFTTRSGGRSVGPHAGLDLAAHVGDDPVSVDGNRAALMSALDIEHLRRRLTTAEQVHGLTLREVSGATAGMGAFADHNGPPSVPATDALYTLDAATPVLLLYADCVPVILVAPGPVRGVAVVHAGWKGALGRLAGKSATRLAQAVGCDTSDLFAYVGPHIGPCHYEVAPERLSQFVDAFGSIASAQGRLDLGAVVYQTLSEVGVSPRNVVSAGVCTAEETGSFYSFRAEGRTGRHGALAVILERDR
jgi:YfiH family protein